MLQYDIDLTTVLQLEKQLNAMGYPTAQPQRGKLLLVHAVHALARPTSGAR